MDIMERLLMNRFDMSQWRTGFVDNFSHMSVAIAKSTMELSELCPRGLIEWREPMTGTLCAIRIKDGSHVGRLHPIYIRHTDTLPWVVRQEAISDAGACSSIIIQSTLVSSALNQLIWNLEVMHESDTEMELTFVLSGCMLNAENGHRIIESEHGVICCFNANSHTSKYITTPQLDGVKPIWAIRSEFVHDVSIDQNSAAYIIELKPLLLSKEKGQSIAIQIDYSDKVGCPDIDYWNPQSLVPIKNIDQLAEENKQRWARLLAPILQESLEGDNVKKLRSAAGLVRCGYLWQNSTHSEGIVASYCSITSWSSTAFFWDSIISSIGLMQFSQKLAQESLLAIYARQRDDGCVPTHSYERFDGSTFYPQAPITAWALMRMLKNGADMDFIRQMLGKVDRLDRWFFDTQDHDRDGLYEWRFSGCPADNSPLFDNYARHTGKDLNGMWNVFLPPIASVGLNSFLIMEAKCLVYLFEKVGDYENAAFYAAHASQMSLKLKEICLENGEMFYDYDNHTRTFNRALTLYSFLPLWAGVEIDGELSKKMIEEYLLDEKHFFRDPPFPHLAFSEDAYRPNGYWRGRIWPHVTIWILELLWSNGYEKQADDAAERLLKLMDQREEILENYDSGALASGGGEPDYNWSFSCYLMLENRVYRTPVLKMLQQ